MVTVIQGASFSFTFYGTEVSITGAKRFGHGHYQGSLDGQRGPVETGEANPDQFKVTLYAATVAKGHHNVTLTNGQDHYLDVDTVSSGTPLLRRLTILGPNNRWRGQQASGRTTSL